MEINLDKINKVHFIGVGGIGISAIARLMKTYGKNVSGSDMSESVVTTKLSEFGIKIFTGHSAENIDQSVDLVIYTIAIPKDNPEYMEAEKRGIHMLSYPQMLSVVSKNMFTIAVSGTHGKTTTTAMLSKIMLDADFDPTVIVGSLMKNSDSNLIVGKSNYFLVEACEYRRSFLNLYPKILIITNVDTDHLDYYKDLSDIQSAFRELAERIPEDGVIICNKHDANLKPILNGLRCKIIDYLEYYDKDMILKSPGTHNKQNASATLAVSDYLKIDLAEAKKSLENFTGTWRRFEYIGITKNGTQIYDDYAHHPTEIKATISGVREMFPDKKCIIFFQPHLFSRTKLLIDEFARVLSQSDQTYILPIYASREIFDDSMKSEMLVKKINENRSGALYVKDFDECVKIIKKLDKNAIVLITGAGDVYKITKEVI